MKDLLLIGGVCALALLHYHISGPYWRLVNSNTKYLDLPEYIQLMSVKLEEWSKCPGSLLSPTCNGIFDGKFHHPTNLPSILSEAQGYQESVKYTLGLCVGKMMEVTQRQWSDFLVGGIYGGEVSDDVKSCLKNCPITNLSGEHAFGDLDYDISQRRRTTVLNRSTRQMQKWNNDAGWLGVKHEEERKRIMKIARKKKAEVRAKFKRQEGIVKLKNREKLLQNKQKKLDIERQNAERKQKIIDKVLKDGGVCREKVDVDQLVTVDSIKSQLQYHKYVLGVKGLTVTGDKDQLIRRLITFLGNGNGEESPSLSKSTSPERKRRICVSSDEEAAAVEEEEAEEEETAVPHVKFTFRDAPQGLWLAVFYDDGPYIGQIIDVVDGNSAEIKFLTASECQKDLYRWPRSESDDVAVVDADYVFMWDLDILPISNDGRTWRLLDHNMRDTCFISPITQ